MLANYFPNMRWKNALIIGASGGIGAALCGALKASDARFTELSRSGDGLDVTDEASVERTLGALDQTYDLLVVATGALEIEGAEPEKSLKQISAKAMMDQFALNAVGPALILRHAARLLDRKSARWLNWRQSPGGLVFLPRGKSSGEPDRSHERDRTCAHAQITCLRRDAPRNGSNTLYRKIRCAPCSCTGARGG